MFMVENKAPSCPSYDQSIQKFNSINTSTFVGI